MFNCPRGLRIGLVILLSPLYIHGMCKASESLDLKRVLKDVRDSRTKIVSGVVRIEQGFLDLERKVSLTNTWLIHFSSDRLRAEREAGDFREVWCWGCYEDDAFIAYSVGHPSLPNGAKMGLSIWDRDEIHPRQFFVPHPRWLGCFPYPILQMYVCHPDVFFSSTGKASPSVVREGEGEQEKWTVRWSSDVASDNQLPAEFSIVVMPRRGFGVIRSQVAWEIGSKGNPVKMLDMVESDLTRVLSADVWFRSRLRYTRWRNGQVVLRENCQIEVLSLNSDVPLQTFALDGISFLEPGTEVFWNRKKPPPYTGRPLIWDGQSIVPDPKYMVGEGTMVQPGRVRWDVLIGANVALLAALATLVSLRRYFRLRKSPSK